MKKFIVILVALIGFGFSVNAQDCVRTTWLKDGQCGTGTSAWSFTAYVDIYNPNDYEVTVYVEATAVHPDGDVKTLSGTFTIKPRSNKTTSGKCAVLDTKWARGVNVSKSTISVRCY